MEHRSIGHSLSIIPRLTKTNLLLPRCPCQCVRDLSEFTPPLHHFKEAPPVAADGRAVDVLVVSPALVPRVIRRVNADALHPAPVVRQQRLEGHEVVTLGDEIARAGIAAAEIGHVFQQVKGHLEVMVDDGFLADPVQCGNRDSPACANQPCAGMASFGGSLVVPENSVGTCLDTSRTKAPEGLTKDVSIRPESGRASNGCLGVL